jgi:hypothetical protein
MRRTNPRRPALRPRLVLEQLEPRETPAGGVVTVLSANGSLTLTGDGNAVGNAVRLVETSAGIFTVSGESGTQVRLGTGAPTTFLNNIAISHNINAKFGNGNDTFTYYGLFNNKMDDFNLSMGAGNDVVFINAVKARDLIITQGTPPSGSGITDDDTITVFNGDINNNLNGFRGKISINNGGGHDQTQLTVGVLKDVTVTNADGNDWTMIAGAVGGSIAVTDAAPPSATSGDAVIMDAVVVGHNVTVTSPGNFYHTTTLDSVTIGGALTLTSGSKAGIATVMSFNSGSVGTNASFTGGAGDDSVTVQGVNVGKNLSVSNNAGSNSTNITDTHVGGALSVSGGAGSDTVTVGGSFSVYVARNGTFNLGDGNNVVNLAGSSGQGIEFGGNLGITAGAGQDQATLAFLTVEGNTNINLGAAADTLTVQHEATFAGNVSVNMGPGADQVTANADGGASISYLGKLSLTLGADADTLNAGTSGGEVMLMGTLTTDASDADTVNVGPHIVEFTFSLF